MLIFRIQTISHLMSMDANNYGARRTRATPAAELEDSVLRSLRRIIQAVDVHSRQIVRDYGVTGPQLACLRQVARSGPVSAGKLARAVSLRPATLSGILDRLEVQAWIRRDRTADDRRLVVVSLTPAGNRLVGRAPPPLQEAFLRRFRALASSDRRRIDAVLRELVTMMAAEEFDAAPMLVPGPSLGGDPLARGGKRRSKTGPTRRAHPA